MSIPILDLGRQYAAIKTEIDNAIQRVVASGRFILGPEVQSFEEQMANYCGVSHAIGVASGTDALLLSLRALGIGPGDGVILPSFTFFATAGVVHNIGATPVFCDIDPHTFNLDPAHVRRTLADPRPRASGNAQPTEIKAIVPVHLYGQMADMAEIMAIAHEHNLYIVEDAAQAIGAECEHSGPEAGEHNSQPKKAGTIGHLGCFSFFPTKNLGAYGDGGMIITNDNALAERLRMLRVHGSRPKYYHQFVGYNSRLDALQAAVLRAKLPHLDTWSEARHQLAARYDELLTETEGLALPYRSPGHTHIFHQYTIRVADGRRDALRENLKARSIGTEIYYPLPLHLQECFAHLGYKAGDLPESERASREALSLPMFPELGSDEQSYVATSIREFFASGRQ